MYPEHRAETALQSQPILLQPKTIPLALRPQIQNRDNREIGQKGGFRGLRGFGLESGLQVRERRGQEFPLLPDQRHQTPLRQPG
jgi:hypothetical protein